MNKRVREYTKILHEEIQKVNIDKLLDQNTKFSSKDNQTNPLNTNLNNNNKNNNINDINNNYNNNNNNNNNSLVKSNNAKLMERVKKMNDSMESSYVKYFIPILRLVYITFSYFFYFLFSR